MVYRCTSVYSNIHGVFGHLKQKLLAADSISSITEFSKLVLPKLNKYYATYGLAAELVETQSENFVAFAATQPPHFINFEDLYPDIDSSAPVEVYSDPVFHGSFAASDAITISFDNKFPENYGVFFDEESDDSEGDNSSSDSTSTRSQTFKENQTVTIRLIRAPTVVQQVAQVAPLSFTPQDLAAVTATLLQGQAAEESQEMPAPSVGTININYKKVGGVFFKINHIDLSNSILVDIEENTIDQDNKKLLALCYDCAEAEEALREAVKALPEAQVTKKKLVQKVLEMVIKTGRNYAKRRLPDLIQVLKETKELIKDDIAPKVVTCAKEVAGTAVALKDHAASKIAKIGSYLKLTKKLNEGAQPRKLIGALMMVAGVALVIAAAVLGFFTGGLSLLILATGVPTMLILGGAAMYKLADTELASAMKTLATEEIKEVIVKEPAPKPTGFAPQASAATSSHSSIPATIRATAL